VVWYVYLTIDLSTYLSAQYNIPPNPPTIYKIFPFLQTLLLSFCLFFSSNPYTYIFIPLSHSVAVSSQFVSASPPSIPSHPFSYFFLFSLISSWSGRCKSYPPSFPFYPRGLYLQNENTSSINMKRSGWARVFSRLAPCVIVMRIGDAILQG
jgi:hypothetical protein